SRNLGFGLFFSITCSEDVPFINEKDVAASTRDTFLGDYRIRQQQAACNLWPKATLPKDYRQPVRSDRPTLFVTGDLDGGTPLWFTDRSPKASPITSSSWLTGRVILNGPSASPENMSSWCGAARYRDSTHRAVRRIRCNRSG